MRDVGDLGEIHFGDNVGEWRRCFSRPASSEFCQIFSDENTKSKVESIKASAVANLTLLQRHKKGFNSFFCLLSIYMYGSKK